MSASELAVQVPEERNGDNTPLFDAFPEGDRTLTHFLKFYGNVILTTHFDNLVCVHLPTCASISVLFSFVFCLNLNLFCFNSNTRAKMQSYDAKLASARHQAGFHGVRCHTLEIPHSCFCVCP